jgi:hypothetical protein
MDVPNISIKDSATADRLRAEGLASIGDFVIAPHLFEPEFPVERSSFSVSCGFGVDY